MFNDYNDILTIDDLCEILMIGKNTAYTILNNGKIKGFKLGRVWKIPKDNVIQYITNQSSN